MSKEEFCNEEHHFLPLATKCTFLKVKTHEEMQPKYPAPCFAFFRRLTANLLDTAITQDSAMMCKYYNIKNRFEILLKGAKTKNVHSVFLLE